MYIQFYVPSWDAPSIHLTLFGFPWQEKNKRAHQISNKWVPHFRHPMGWWNSKGTYTESTKNLVIHRKNLLSVYHKLYSCTIRNSRMYPALPPWIWALWLLNGLLLIVSYHSEGQWSSSPGTYSIISTLGTVPNWFYKEMQSQSIVSSFIPYKLCPSSRP